VHLHKALRLHKDPKQHDNKKLETGLKSMENRVLRPQVTEGKMESLKAPPKPKPRLQQQQQKWTRSKHKRRRPITVMANNQKRRRRKHRKQKDARQYHDDI